MVDEVFVDRVSALKRFLWEHGRLPRTSDGVLGRWLCTMRSSASPEESLVLDTWVPGWRRSRHQELLVLRVARLSAFYGEHGRYPRPSESADGKWLTDQRTRASVEVAAVLDRECPGWRGKSRRRVTFEVFVDELETFVSEHGRFPRRSDGSLGVWLMNQRCQASEERRAFLDERIPGWRG